MKIRPSVLIICMGLIAIGGAALPLGHIEVTTGCIGGLLGLATKLIEGD